MRLLNLGCGRRFHPDWVNLDVVEHVPGVRAHDVRRGLPFPRDHFDAVYHSHLLEHFSRSEGALLLAECFRVLRPGGTIRIAVPDLERMAALYLDAVRDVRAGLPGARERHEWLLLEMFDQAARHRSGGDIAEFLEKGGEQVRRFAVERWGAEARDLLASASPRRARSRKLVSAAARLIHPARWPPLLLRALGGERWRLGEFRSSGEVHLCMYDSALLAARLLDAGFDRSRTVSATESSIPGWPRFELDADAAGRPHKPDSFYMEAIKPGGPST